jgi:hypothetical protein
MPTKVIVTAESAMKKKYGVSWAKVRQAVGRLIKKDAARGITTTLVALDGADLGTHRAKAGQPETFKAAIDHVWALHHQPDYILFFLHLAIDGATLGRALLEARLRFVEEETP